MGRWGENLFDDDSMLDAIMGYEMGNPWHVAESKIKIVVDNDDEPLDIDDAAEVLIGLLYILINFGYEFDDMEHLLSLPQIPDGLELDITKKELLKCCKLLSDEEFNYMAEGIDPSIFKDMLKYIEKEM